MTEMGYKRRMGILACCLLLAMAGLATAAAEMPDAYRAATYFDRGYSVYGSAVASGEGQYTVEVFLQFAPGFKASEHVMSYALYVDDQRQEPLTAAEGETAEVPMHFVGQMAAASSPASIRIVPVFGSGNALEAEGLELVPPQEGASKVGMVGVVSNPTPTDRLNLRSAPNADGESLRQYYNGVPVYILGELPDGWVAVSIGSEGGMARGYMKADFLATGDAAEKVEAMMPSFEAVVASWTLYSYPEEGSVAVGTYGLGQPFEILGRSSAWWHIRMGDKTGFVRADVLATLPQTEEAGQTPAPAPETEAPQQTQKPASGKLRRFTAERDMEQGYGVKAFLRETAAGQFEVQVNLQYPAEHQAADEIRAYVLYVNGERKAEVPSDWSMRTAIGPAQGFRTVLAIPEAIDAITLVPQREAGGESQAEAIGLTLE